MILHRLTSLIRRATGLLPTPFRLRALTFIDCLIGAAESENVHVPPLLPKHQRRVAVDVGANNGVTTCIMAGLFSKVHAFEANPVLCKDLETVAPANVEVHGVALSSNAGEAVLTVPISAGVTLSGWGSVEAPLLDHFESSSRIPVRADTLDSFGFTHVDLLKIDVEGHEMAVLAGAAETIRRCCPWLIIESVGEVSERVRELVLSLGYQETTLQMLTGRKGSKHNMIFIPSARS